MRLVLIGVLAATVAAIGAETGKSDLKPAVSPTQPVTKASVQREFAKLEAEDDAAQAEVEKWKRESAEKQNKDQADAELEERIKARLEPIQKAYRDFLKRHPDHAGAHLAYGCFLNERQDETGARQEWERALELDPNNAAIYNNLGGSYSEGGPAKKAFDYFNKAIELQPTEAAYYHNFGTTLYVLRKSGMNYYQVDEQGVFGKIIGLYSNAVRLDPQNFSFAVDLAQTYYSLKPLPVETALASWTNALHTARAETEREETYVHLARVKMLAGELAESRALLNLVTNATQAQLKANLVRAIELREGSKTPPTAEPKSR